MKKLVIYQAVLSSAVVAGFLALLKAYEVFHGPTVAVFAAPVTIAAALFSAAAIANDCVGIKIAAVVIASAITAVALTLWVVLTAESLALFFVGAPVAAFCLLMSLIIIGGVSQEYVTENTLPKKRVFAAMLIQGAAVSAAMLLCLAAL